MAVASTLWPAGTDLARRFTDVRLLRLGSRFAISVAREHAIDGGPSRTVVLKVPERSGTSWLDEVVDAEAAVLTALRSHPHVVTLHEVLELPDGRHALVLDHCPGTLYDAVHADDDALPVSTVVAIGVKIAGALQALHGHRIVHCDVRPRTVLLAASREPVLAGFDECVRLDALDTRPPMHNLTPHTAPELLEGADPSPASDVYGLASTLYELAAGRAAFGAYVGESPASVIVRVLGSRPKPVVAPGVPLELTDLIAWAMAPDPADRPPSPAWLAEELHRIELRQGWPRTPFVA
jgi:serine/threonine protein kinase